MGHAEDNAHFTAAGLDLSDPGGRGLGRRGSHLLVFDASQPPGMQAEMCAKKMELRDQVIHHCWACPQWLGIQQPNVIS